MDMYPVIASPKHSPLLHRLIHHLVRLGFSPTECSPPRYFGEAKKKEYGHLACFLVND